MDAQLQPQGLAKGRPKPPTIIIEDDILPNNKVQGGRRPNNSTHHPVTQVLKHSQASKPYQSSTLNQNRRHEGSPDSPIILDPSEGGQVENWPAHIHGEQVNRQGHPYVASSSATMHVAEMGQRLLHKLPSPLSSSFQKTDTMLSTAARGLAIEDQSSSASGPSVDQSVGLGYHNGSAHSEASSATQVRAAGIGNVVSLFPGICRNYVSDIWDKEDIPSSEAVIQAILDKLENGESYPKARDTEKDLKRKRAIDSDEEAAKRYAAPERIVVPAVDHIKLMRSLLSHEFPSTPMVLINRALRETSYRLFPAYQAIEDADRKLDSEQSNYYRIKRPRKQEKQFMDIELDQTIATPDTEEWNREFLTEFRLARKLTREAKAKRHAEREAELEEERNIREAEAQGQIGECGCCICEFPFNRMVHCANETVTHWFCRACAKLNADTIIGQSKYQLHCMSMDGCTAGFSLEQRSKFLDEATVIALDRIEKEAVLRLAGIENLVSCPFCPYAAEYPPVEIDKEFRCQAPDCEKVSCRLCRLESHIPLSCEEFAKQGLSLRREIEEAMSAALIRKCNKCGTPFIKEEGCNKMTCTRNGCHNMQCYICHESCDYNHFEGRGGKPGSCPLFDNVEHRHQDEVERAERIALQQVQAKHPEYTEEDLKVHVSQVVKEDEAKRRAKVPDRRNVPQQVPQHPHFALRHQNGQNVVVAVPPNYPGYARDGLGHHHFQGGQFFQPALPPALPLPLPGRPQPPQLPFARQ